MGKTLGATGNRPHKFPWDYNSERKFGYLRDMNEIVERYVNEGFDHFIAGGAMGVDQDFALTVLRLKKKYPHVSLELALPHPDYAKTFDDFSKWRDKQISDAADKATMVSDRYSSYCMQRRNEYIVDHSDAVIAFWNMEKSGGTYNTIRYAERSHVFVERYDLRLSGKK